MKKIKFSKEFRFRLSEKLMDLGNLVIGGLVLAQFINMQNFSSSLVVSGLVIAIICYIISYIVSYTKR